MNFSVNLPLNGHDEDAPPVADERLLMVCDGLGGSGQNTYIVDGEKRTSAYLGSRRLSEACRDFVFGHWEELRGHLQEPEAFVGELKAHISASLDEYVREKELKNLVRGKSMQMLPSTLAAILYLPDEDGTEALVLSAGDSRAFVLTPEEGLRQLSVDDVFEDVDAFEKAATMTNNVRQDGAYHINFGYFRLPAQCILLVCSDGCFDYLSTPMELEFLLDCSVVKCGDVLDAEKNCLGEYFGGLLVRKGLKDDCTMAGAVVGYSDAKRMQRLFYERARFVQETYLEPCKNCGQSEPQPSENGESLPELKQRLDALGSKVNACLKELLLQMFREDERGESAENSQEIGETIPELGDFIKQSDRYREFREKLWQEDAEREKRKEEQIGQRKLIENNLPMDFAEARWEDPEQDVLENCCYGRSMEKLRRRYDKIKAKMERCQAEMEQCKTEWIALWNKSDLALVEWAAAWGSQFAAYRSEPVYNRVVAEYDRNIELEREIKASHPLSPEERQERFQLFLEQNRGEFLQKIKTNGSLFERLCKIGEADADELLRLEKEYSARKRSGVPPQDKYALWEKYKPGYELYREAVGGRI